MIKKLVTHNGSFHADDIFACAVLSLMLEKNNEKFEIIRTRDEEITKTGDYVFDVGGIYDADKNRFDHHQVGGAGQRSNGIEYSSFGLVWKKFGIELCDDEEVVDVVDKKLVSPIDAGDNGINLFGDNKYETLPYLIQNVFYVMRPTWKEDDEDGRHTFEMFLKSVNIAKMVLSREIIQIQDMLSAEESVISFYNKAEDKRIIVLDKSYPVEYVLNNFPEPLFVVYPKKTDTSWGVKAVRQNPETFENRKDFPQAWAGLRDEELQKVTGVGDAVFCHRGLFLAVAKSKEGAIALAKKALAS